MMKDFCLAVCQMHVKDNKESNIRRASAMLEEAARKGAHMAVLPEMFNCPYDNRKFPEYAEELADSFTAKALGAKARELGIGVVAGSIPEKEGERIYNTSLVLDAKGNILARHRKMHLFDIDVPGKITFKESEILSAGKEVTVVETEWCKLGVAICFDIRFPELSRLMALQGAELIVLPGAFNMVTGPAHWEILMRTRALDNQVYLAAASPARDTAASYIAYGHSMVVSPWGEILQKAGEGEEIITVRMDPAEIERVRKELPLLRQRREDIYRLDLATSDKATNKQFTTEA